MVRRPVLEGRRYFAAVLYRAVDDPSTDSIISWSQDGKSFIVWDVEEFCRVLVHKFSQTKFQFFAHRLKTYGFTKVESEHQLEYANDDFVRGKPELAVQIEIRRLKSFITSPPMNLEEFPPGTVTPEMTIASLLAAEEKDKAIAKDLSQLTKKKGKAIAKDLSKLTI